MKYVVTFESIFRNLLFLCLLLGLNSALTGCAPSDGTTGIEPDNTVFQIGDYVVSSKVGCNQACKIYLDTVDSERDGAADTVDINRAADLMNAACTVNNQVARCVNWTNY